MLTWHKAPKNNGYFAKTEAGEYHVYRAEKGKRAHEATLNGEVIGLWSDAADAMADIDRSETGRETYPPTQAGDSQCPPTQSKAGG